MVFATLPHFCHNCHNYNSSYAIVAGLTHPQIGRRRRTWEVVNKNAMKQYNKLLDTGASTNAPTIFGINIAVRGYGLLAGACKLLLAPEQLHQLFSGVLNASHHAIYQ